MAGWESSYNIMFLKLSTVSWMFGCDRIEKSDVLPLNTLLSFCSPPNTHTKRHLSGVLCRALRPTVFTSVDF